MKKYSFSKYMSLIFVFSMLLQCFGFPVSALGEQSPLETELQAVEEIAMPDIINAVTPSDTSYINRVYDREQSLGDVTFETDRRTYVSYIFAEDVKFIDANGKTVDKDTTLVSVTGGYQQKSNDIQSFMPTNISTGITFSADEYAVSFAPVQAQNVVVAPISVSNNGYGKNYAIYNRVFGENTSLRYTPYYSSLKEEIILNTYTAQNQFSFLYYTNGLVFDGLNLVNAAGEEIFTFPELVAYDTNGKSVVCDYEITTVKPGEIYAFTVIVPQDYLVDPSTEYPVYVDPSVNFLPGTGTNKRFKDTTVYTGQTASVSATKTTLSVGLVNVDKEALTLIQCEYLLTNSYYRGILSNENLEKKVTLGVCTLNPDYSANVDVKAITSTWDEATALYSGISLRSTPVFSIEAGEDMGTDKHGEGTGYWYLLDISSLSEELCADTPTVHGVALDASTYTGCMNIASCENATSESRPFITAEYSIVPLPTTQTPGVVSGALYSIRNNSDSFYALTSSNTVTLEQYIATNQDQKFEVIYKGNGKYVIRERNDNIMLLGLSNGYIDVVYNDDPTAYWYIVPVATGSQIYYLINETQKFGLMDVEPLSAGQRIIYDDMNTFGTWTLVGEVYGANDPNGTAGELIHEYAYFTQNDPSRGSYWNLDRIDELYCYQDSENNKIDFESQLISDVACVMDDYAMMLNNYDVWMPYYYDDPRTSDVEEWCDVPIDPFTVTVANCSQNGVLPTFNTSDIMTPPDSNPVSLNEYGVPMGNALGVDIVRVNKNALTNISVAEQGDSVIDVLEKLLPEHPEGIILRFEKYGEDGKLKGHVVLVVDILPGTDDSLNRLLCFDSVFLDSKSKDNEPVSFNNTWTSTVYNANNLKWLSFIDHGGEIN